MRILSVTAQKPDSTGSGVFLTELVKGFQKAGHQQAIVCGTVHQESIHIPAGVAVFPVYYQSADVPFPVCGMSDEMPYHSTRYCDMNERMTDQLLRAFRKTVLEAVEVFRPDVILCHHLYFLTALVREMYPGIPVYGQCHGSDLRQFVKNPWQHEWILSRISQLDGIFALHEEQKKQICFLFNVPQEKVHVLGTGYNSDVFFVNASVKQARQSEKIRLIFAGKISEKKGVMSLLRSLRYVRHPECYELALAGGYGNQQEYERICQLAQEAPCTVTFLGKLSHPALAEEMNRSDVFVLPSFYEGLPLVLMEAMACGLQAICTDLPGIRLWMNRAVPEHGVLFVKPPEMENADEAVPESLPEFEKRLAAAIDTVGFMPQPNLDQVRQVSWDALCKKIVSLWNEGGCYGTAAEHPGRTVPHGSVQ